MKRIAIALTAMLAACGGNSAATDHNKPGSGSSTLLVTADVTASTSSSGPVTNFQVDVKDGMGAKVSGATVTLTNNELGSVPLVEANAGSGRYVNSRAQ